MTHLLKEGTVLAAEVHPCGQICPQRGQHTTERLSCLVAFLWISATEIGKTSGGRQHLRVQTVEREAQCAEERHSTQPEGGSITAVLSVGACPLEGAFSPRDCLQTHHGLCVLKTNGKHLASCFLGKA